MASERYVGKFGALAYAPAVESQAEALGCGAGSWSRSVHAVYCPEAAGEPEGPVCVNEPQTPSGARSAVLGAVNAGFDGVMTA